MKHRASFPPIGWTPLQVGTLISFWLLCFRFRNRGPSQTRRHCTAMPSARRRSRRSRWRGGRRRYPGGGRGAPPRWAIHRRAKHSVVILNSRPARQPETINSTL